MNAPEGEQSKELIGERDCVFLYLADGTGPILSPTLWLNCTVFAEARRVV